MTELWDIYDNSRKLTGRLFARGSGELKIGECHFVSEVWTVNTDGRILITLRHEDKSECPGLWENTAGCAVAGESGIECALRELKEEVGVFVDKSDLNLLFEINEPDLHIIGESYLLVKDFLQIDIKLQPGETADAKFVSLNQLHKMMNEGYVAPFTIRRFSNYRGKIENIIDNIVKNRA